MTRKQFIASVLALAPLLGFLWAFAEGTIFFIVPDVLISLVALFSFRRFSVCAIAATLGSIIAGMLVYYMAAYQPADTKTIIQSVPFVTQKMFVAVQTGYDHHGAWALATAPISGIPYKIHAFLAPAHVEMLPFILISIPARLLRFFVVGGLSFLIGFLARRRKGNPSGKLLAAHAIFWSIFYALYWLKVMQP